MKSRKVEKTVTLNIAVSDELHARIKARAAMEFMSMAALVRRILGIPPLRNYVRLPKSVKRTK
jgi:plasmid stability protein